MREKEVMYRLCQFLIGKVQRIHWGTVGKAHGTQWKCQFLIGKVQQHQWEWTSVYIGWWNGTLWCQFLIGKVQLPFLRLFLLDYSLFLAFSSHFLSKSPSTQFFVISDFSCNSGLFWSFPYPTQILVKVDGLFCQFLPIFACIFSLCLSRMSFQSLILLT